MNILLTRSLNLVEYDIKNSFINSKENFSILSFTSKLMGFPESTKCIGNFFYCFSQIKAKEFYIGKSIPLLRSNWSKAFLNLILDNCIENQSTLKLNIFPQSKYDLGFITLNWIKENFKGYKIQIIKKDLISISKKDRNQKQINYFSTINWATKNFHELLNIDLSTKYLPHMNSFLLKTLSTKNYISKDTEFNLIEKNLLAKYKNKSQDEFFNENNADLLSGYVPWKEDSAQIDFAKEISNSIGTMSYYIAGMAYKAPQISNIIKRHCRKNKNLTVCDYGGGYGLLLSELILDDSLDISYCYLRDILTQNLIFFHNLYRFFNQKFRNSFEISVGSVQNLNSFKKCSVAIFVGALLYVPKDKREDVLKKVWDSLEKGGILIVHENIKYPSYTTDYEIMFTVKEIEELLSKFGEIIRYKSNNFSQISYADLGERDTLFRVLVKD